MALVEPIPEFTKQTSFRVSVATPQGQAHVATASQDGGTADVEPQRETKLNAANALAWGVYYKAVAEMLMRLSNEPPPRPDAKAPVTR